MTDPVNPTPAIASPSDIEEMRAGLEGVTPGDWTVEAGDSVVCVLADGVPILATNTKRYYERHDAGDEALARHIARCSRAAISRLLAAYDARGEEQFQPRVKPWMMACFGAEISADVTERNHRFLEEALELVQSKGCTADEAHQLVDYVYGRDVGDPPQEVGGVMVTLAALCLAAGMDMHACAETELARVWTKVEKIRAKQAAKPKHSPLPQHVSPTAEKQLAEAKARIGELEGVVGAARRLAQENARNGERHDD